MAFANPIIIAVFFAIGLGLLVFLALPGRQRISFGDPQGPSYRQRIQSSLRQAGLFDYSPSIFFVALAGITTVIAAIIVILLGKIYFALLAPLVVFIGWHFFLSSRRQRFRERSYQELIPFLNRISTAVQGGLPIQSAYLQAVEDSVALKPALADSAAKISSGAEFIPSLVETIPMLPIRMWAIFVRQMELNEQVGGDLRRGLQTTIDQLAKMQRLQAEAQADFSIQKKQQQVIVLIVALGIFSLLFLLPGASERLETTIGSPVGIVMMIIGVAVMIIGIVFLNKQIEDIDRKLNA
jgi:Flp pilus assembly protein TadB